MKRSVQLVEEYLDRLPDDRRLLIETVRNVILANLDRDIEEDVHYGMISYYVPHRIYPAGYHCDPRRPLPYAGLAAQKNHAAIYLMTVYSEPAHLKWFQNAWKATGKKLDMGKSCIRFKKLEDVALDVIGEAFRRVPASVYIANYERIVRRSDQNTADRGGAPASGSKAEARKTSIKKTASSATSKPSQKSTAAAKKKPAKKAASRRK